jgi:hypothetical protein
VIRPVIRTSHPVGMAFGCMAMTAAAMRVHHGRSHTADGQCVGLEGDGAFHDQLVRILEGAGRSTRSVVLE